MDIAVVIGVYPCTAPDCPDPSYPADFQNPYVLYNGAYNPAMQIGYLGYQVPSQNFTITIPSQIKKGPAQLAVLHVGTYGVSLGFCRYVVSSEWILTIGTGVLVLPFY